MGAPTTKKPFRLSVCICTRNRADELANAIESVQASQRPVHEIIVSDDSTSDQTRESLRRFGDAIRFVEGPRRGLCANRNTALEHVTGTHVLFMDDDAALGGTFVDEVAGALEACDEDLVGRTVIVGLERNNGRIVVPGETTFWGHQASQYRLGEAISTIVINAAVFPVGAFDGVRFDENLTYGSDEVDLASRLVQRGYVLTLCLQAINDHFPSPANREYYAPYVDASRLYVTFKRYYLTEGKPGKAVLYALLAPLHLLASRLRSRPTSAVMTTLRTLLLAGTYASRLRAGRQAG